MLQNEHAITNSCIYQKKLELRPSAATVEDQVGICCCGIFFWMRGFPCVGILQRRSSGIDTDSGRSGGSGSGSGRGSGTGTGSGIGSGNCVLAC